MKKDELKSITEKLIETFHEAGKESINLRNHRTGVQEKRTHDSRRGEICVRFENDEREISTDVDEIPATMERESD